MKGITTFLSSFKTNFNLELLGNSTAEKVPQYLKLDRSNRRVTPVFGYRPYTKQSFPFSVLFFLALGWPESASSILFCFKFLRPATLSLRAGEI